MKVHKGIRGVAIGGAVVLSTLSLAAVPLTLQATGVTNTSSASAHDNTVSLWVTCTDYQWVLHGSVANDYGIGETIIDSSDQSLFANGATIAANGTLPGTEVLAAPVDKTVTITAVWDDNWPSPAGLTRSGSISTSDFEGSCTPPPPPPSYQTEPSIITVAATCGAGETGSLSDTPGAGLDGITTATDSFPDDTSETGPGTFFFKVVSTPIGANPALPFDPSIADATHVLSDGGFTLTITVTLDGPLTGEACTTPPTKVTLGIPPKKDLCGTENDHYGLLPDTDAVAYSRDGLDIIATLKSDSYTFDTLPSGWVDNGDGTATYAFTNTEWTNTPCDTSTPPPTDTPTAPPTTTPTIPGGGTDGGDIVSSSHVSNNGTPLIGNPLIDVLLALIALILAGGVVASFRPDLARRLVATLRPRSGSEN